MPDYTLSTSKYTIRDGQAEDLPGIVQLYADAGPDDYIEAETWHWLHQNNPYSLQKVLVGLDNSGEIVAHIGVVPFQFVADEKTWLAGLPCQLMIAEAYRQTLLFPNLESRFLREYKDLGINFVYALVNRPRVLKAHLTLGFQTVGTLSVYARPYRLSKLVKHYLPNKILNSLIKPGLIVGHQLLRLNWPQRHSHLTIENVSQFGEAVDPFLKIIQKHFDYMTLRNCEILSWRFVHSPNRPYQIFVVKEQRNVVGYIVLRQMKMKQFDVLAIVDILFSPDRLDVGDALLDVAHKEAVKAKVDMSTCLLSPCDPLLPALKKSGYLKTPETFTLIVHEPKNDSGHFKNSSFEQWHITWFDHDYV